MECLIKGCDAPRKHCRGLCLQHYSIAVDQVRRNKTTWQELYELGMCELSRRGAEKGPKLIQFEEQIAESRTKRP
jgi:hypothetical protein